MSRLERQAVRGIGYGGDYNPEQWPETTWAEDIRLMGERSEEHTSELQSPC